MVNPLCCCSSEAAMELCWGQPWGSQLWGVPERPLLNPALSPSMAQCPQPLSFLPPSQLLRVENDISLSHFGMSSRHSHPPSS